jgi:membrane protein YdbS with pleckstrin-like domain
MTDTYPESFTVEIDRDALCRYYRLQSLLVCAIFPIYFGFLGGGYSVAANDFPYHFGSGMAPWMAFLWGTVLGILFGLLLGAICYFLFAHFRARRRAHTLSVQVEGPFLRVIEGAYIVRDRRLHFQAITDYSTSSNPLLRFCDIGQLILETTAGGRSSTIRIPGVKNAQEVRDMLSELDRLREDS